MTVSSRLTRLTIRQRDLSSLFGNVSIMAVRVAREAVATEQAAKATKEEAERAAKEAAAASRTAGFYRSLLERLKLSMLRFCRIIKSFHCMMRVKFPQILAQTCMASRTASRH
jgi:hypothetical protein